MTQHPFSEDAKRSGRIRRRERAFRLGLTEESDNDEAGSATVRCPHCQTLNRVPQGNRSTLLLACGRCGNEIGISRPMRVYLREMAIFARNLGFLLLVPALSAYSFNHNYLPVSSGFLFCVSIAILSVALHEFFHAVTAFLFGDQTILERGYLRLSLRKYFDGLYSLILPVLVLLLTGIFVPGGAVLIRFDKVKNVLLHSVIYFSGVVANGLILIVLLYFAGIWEERNPVFFALLQYSAFLQLLFIALNLLPIPGLDGWNIIAPLFSQNVQKIAVRISPVAIAAFVFAIILYPPLTNTLLGPIEIFSAKLGLEAEAVQRGMDYMFLFRGGNCLICSEVIKELTDR